MSMPSNNQENVYRSAVKRNHVNFAKMVAHRAAYHNVASKGSVALHCDFKNLE